MDRHRYDELASRLEGLEVRLITAGFPKHDRIRSHIKSIRNLAEAQQSGNLVSFAENLDDQRRRALNWAFAEGLEFAEAVESLEERGRAVPLEVLERALGGPVDPSLESKRNNLGRNTTFELVLAGDLAAAGLQPELGAEPDIIAEFLNRRLLIACKRPLHAETVPDQIKGNAR